MQSHGYMNACECLESQSKSCPRNSDIHRLIEQAARDPLMTDGTKIDLLYFKVLMRQCIGGVIGRLYLESWREKK